MHTCQNSFSVSVSHETSACAAWAKGKAQINSQSSAERPRLPSKAGKALFYDTIKDCILEKPKHF